MFTQDKMYFLKLLQHSEQFRVLSNVWYLDFLNMTDDILIFNIFFDQLKMSIATAIFYLIIFDQHFSFFVGQK